jgi:tRNA threonylcarbamoyladenosine biosynthesis protein TsaB
MQILGLDTATPQAGVAIGGPDGVIASFRLVNRGRHAETVAPAIEHVCRMAGTTLDAITELAIDVGPGLFTGLRVGIATANAIAFARGIPIIPVSSLEILAHAARLTSRRIVSVIDALSGEVYFASYRSEGTGVRALTEPRLATPDAVAAELAALEEDILVVGDGAQHYAERFASSGNRITVAGASFQYPSAANLVEIATARSLHGEFAPGADVQILYLKKPYVQEKASAGTS